MASIHKRVSDRTGTVSWQVKYRTPTGAARSSTFALRRDAAEFARTTDSARVAGTFVDPRRSRIRLGPWLDTWLESRTNLAPSTRARYRSIIEAHIAPVWGVVELADVHHDDVQAWVAGIDRSPATTRKAFYVLSQALDYAVRSGRLGRNPADGVSLPRPQASERRYLTHQQVEALACEVPDRWALLVRFLAYTGLRWGEVAALRVRDVHLDRRRVTVARSVTPIHGRLTFGPTKGHERREVPVPGFLAAGLSAMVQGKGIDDLVLTGAHGGTLRAGTFQTRVLTPAAARVGLQGLHPHELRHTAASLAIAAGADVKVVQSMLGHKSATMTLDLYGHLFPDRLDVVADALERARAAAIADPAFPKRSQA